MGRNDRPMGHIGRIQLICYHTSMKRNHRFSIVIEEDKDGFFALCPELQGCYSQGNSYEEAMENIKDAIRLHLVDRIASREKLPESKSISLSTVEVVV